MAFPASATALGKVVQSSEGTNSETYTVPSVTTGYHLGAGLTPPQPSTWINIPDGAYPITPPAAPTTGTGTGFAGGGLTANGAYNWALTSVTDFGETSAGPQLVVPNVGSYTGYILNLPAVTEGTTDNPVRKRRLYRTVNGGAQLKFVCEIGDLSLTTWHDALPDLQLGDNAPATNTSGVTGTVTLAGGGVSVWTERSPSLNQGSMASGDFVVNRQTGNIIHATADFSRTGVTCNWSGATLDTAQLVRDVITAIRDTAGAAVALSPAAQQAGSINISGALTTGGEVVANLMGTRGSSLTHTFTAGAASGTSPNWAGATPGTTIIGRGNAGGLYFYFGTGTPSSGVAFHVTFSSPLPTSNYIVLFTSGAAGGGVNTVVTGNVSYANQTVNGFDVYFNTIVAGAAYNVEYLIGLIG